ncbi:MAG: peptidylprolyl isomerase [Halobacteriovorax sp.]|nr:peptidylprolyl isomerase [Halobacteriovorax sp.]|tara:strand:- start:45971 stop:46258 length:288 start_codon:yes stop_codon:yes gene_type:complete
MNDSRRKYKCRHILVEDLEDAEYVLEKLSEGEEFFNLAKDLSECDSAKNGGLLPSFRSGQMAAEFERAVHNMEIGETSKPIKTEYGYHIIQRLEI